MARTPVSRSLPIHLPCVADDMKIPGYRTQNKSLFGHSCHKLAEIMCDKPPEHCHTFI